MATTDQPWTAEANGKDKAPSQGKAEVSARESGQKLKLK